MRILSFLFYLASGIYRGYAVTNIQIYWIVIDKAEVDCRQSLIYNQIYNRNWNPLITVHKTWPFCLAMIFPEVLVTNTESPGY